MCLKLQRGGCPTFYSDGIIEAQNANGELFGFERGRELSTQPAATIMETAKRFGQQDDITVIAVTRNIAAQPPAWASAATAPDLGMATL